MFGLTKRIAMIVLSIWLILTGLFAVANIGFSAAGLVLNLLAMAAGVLILLQGESWTGKIGMILLGIWLLAQALVSLVGFGFQGLSLVLSLLLIVAGAMILLEE